jgi:peptidoglycan/LPS O-acetylase OafA/YrhL
MSSKFRNDINGLRALAVAAVIIYHFNSSYMSSGFAGVDVFFVISGYLMTSIIVNKFNDGNFKLFDFYLSRAKRIIPSLIIVCFALLIFGFLLIEPGTYQLIGKHSASSLTFISNFTYLFESGYFDQSSKEKFLLHTWSLSVEWQFYLIYPFIIISISKLFGITRLRAALASLSVIGFIISLIISKEDISLSYYMFFSRAWEMIVGGVIFLLPSIMTQTKRLTLEIIGCIGIILSFFIFTEQTLWPGTPTLMPVMFTALVIYANNEKSILSARPIQLIGKISYSIYLVHWVILVSLKKLYIDFGFAAYLISTLMLSFALYHFVEKRRSFGKIWVYLYVLCFLISLAVSLNGVRSRTSGSDDYRMSLQEFRDKYEGSDGVKDSLKPIFFNSNEDDFEYILIGSSHAKHYYSYIKSKGLKVVSLALDGCNSTKNRYTNYRPESCAPRYDQVVKFINGHPGKKVVWATLWTWVGIPRDSSKNNNESTLDVINEEVTAFIGDINKSNSDIYLIGDVPGTKKLTFECMAKNSLPLNRYFNLGGCSDKQKYEDDGVDATLSSIARKYDNVHFIGAANSLCSSGECMLISEGKPIYTDYGHLSKYGANIVGKYIFSKVN